MPNLTPLGTAAACVAAWSLLCAPPLGAGNERGSEVHLFILAGQSNMRHIKPDKIFTPTVERALSGEVIVVKDAAGGQPIRRWYRDWSSATGKRGKKNGNLYHRLMRKVRGACGKKRPDTISFVWMQGEADAMDNHGEIYADSLRGLIGQLRKDLGREDVNVVVGRLNDYRKGDRRTPHWDIVREAQVTVAEEDPRGAWVDTDDLNGPRDRLHLSKEGYLVLAERFAVKALELIHRAGPDRRRTDDR